MTVKLIHIAQLRDTSSYTPLNTSLVKFQHNTADDLLFTEHELTEILYALLDAIPSLAEDIEITHDQALQPHLKEWPKIAHKITQHLHGRPYRN